jgi:hypothetical protein
MLPEANVKGTYRNLEIEPLGGSTYGDEFWPLTAADADQTEAILGWSLPSSYREFATRFGICCPSVDHLLRMRSGDVEDPAMDVFFGSHPADRLAYSVLNAAQLIEEPRVLGFAYATTGMFFMAQDGSILFQKSRYVVLYEAADSFDDFLARLYPDPEPV